MVEPVTDTFNADWASPPGELIEVVLEVGQNVGAAGDDANAVD